MYTGSTFIDLDDYEKVKDIKWCLAADGYAFNYKVGKLHRFIYPNKDEIKGKMVDHIDRDKLNNRKSNLRPATASENGLNRGLNKKGTVTNYKNVRHHADSKLYYVTIIYIKKRSIVKVLVMDPIVVVQKRKRCKTLLTGETQHGWSLTPNFVL